MNLTEERFLKEVASHEMEVLRDDELYRHIRFRRPGTFCMGFDLVTWPGYLAYSGDMGCYVFSCIPDMLQFFRAPAGRTDLPINPDYWREKVYAADRNGTMQWSEERFRERLNDYLDSAEASVDVRREVEWKLRRIDSNEHEMMRFVVDFEHQGFRFQDAWEWHCHEYTHRYVWCCYALVWGIRKYDESRSAVSERTVYAGPGIAIV